MDALPGDWLNPSTFQGAVGLVGHRDRSYGQGMIGSALGLSDTVWGVVAGGLTSLGGVALAGRSARRRESERHEHELAMAREARDQDRKAVSYQALAVNLRRIVMIVSRTARRGFRAIAAAVETWNMVPEPSRDEKWEVQLETLSTALEAKRSEVIDRANVIARLIRVELGTTGLPRL